ncbi:MAG: PQQ-binding-like beta-propeller repeat protein [Verrucomicrobiales bacterium]
MPDQLPSPKRNSCGWIPLVILLVCLCPIPYLYYRDYYGRQVVSAALALLAFAVAGLWFCFFNRLPWKRKFLRVAIVGGIALVAAGAAVSVVRYDGSRDGSSLPQFRFVWDKPKDALLPELPGEAPAAGDLAPAPDDAADWNGFLGETRLGTAPVAIDPDWAAHPPEELWRRPIGLGWSSFSVAGRRVLTQEQRGDAEIVSCYDLVTGEPLWAHENQVRFSEPLGGDGPRATPAFRDNRVYALGATGILDCLDLQSGASIWTCHILDGRDNITYGKAASPLLIGDQVIVTGGKGGPEIMAFAAADGAPLWQAGDDDAAYAAPVHATLAGREQILVVNGHSVAGFDPQGGGKLWSHPWPGKMPKVGQPVPVAPDRVLVSASYDQGAKLIRLTPSGDGFAAEELWESNQLKTKFSTALVQGDHAYGLDEGRFACISLADGERTWKDGRYGYGQNLLVNGGSHILVQTERGDVVLVETNPDELREVARLEALTSGSKTWNAPALAGAYLLVRNDEEAACFRLKLK